MWPILVFFMSVTLFNHEMHNCDTKYLSQECPHKDRSTKIKNKKPHISTHFKNDKCIKFSSEPQLKDV